MAQLTLYHAPSSFFSQRARLAFAEKNVKYKSVEVAIVAGEQLEPWYARIHPLMTVPGLVVAGGTKFIDSEAIIHFVDQIMPEAPPLFPDENTPEGQKCSRFLELLKVVKIEAVSFGTLIDPQYAQGFKSFLSSDKIYKIMNSNIEKVKRYAEKYKDLRYEYLNKATALSQNLAMMKEKNILRKSLDVVENVLTEIETELARVNNDSQDVPPDERPWLCGKQFTVADIYLATILHRLVFLGYSYYWISGRRPNMDAYYQRILQRESFRKSCLHANDIFWAVTVPTLRYKIKCATPWLLGASAVVAAAIAVYVHYRTR